VEWSNDRAIGRLRKFGFPRQPGTESVIKARDIIYEDLKGNVDNVRIEEFRYRNVMKEVMMFWGTLLLVLILLKAIFWVSLYWLSMILGIIGITFLILIMVRFGYRQVFSRFNNKGPITGYNIIASIPAEIKEKKVIILGAHYDTKSVPDIKLMVSKFIMYVPLIVNLIVIIFGILLIFFYYSILWWTSIIVWAGSLLEFVTLGIYTLNIRIENESPGINDNGSGVAIVLELASIFSKNPLKNVTLECVLFDGEEIGLQGSSAYISLKILDF